MSRRSVTWRSTAWAGVPLVLAGLWAAWRLELGAPPPTPGEAAAALIASSVCTVPVVLPQRGRWAETVLADPFRMADRPPARAAQAAPRERRT